MSLTASLVCHPRTPCTTTKAIHVQATLSGNGDLKLTYLLKGELEQICIPRPGPALRANRLWENTCFEAFISCRGEESYREFNFSPSGAWASYAFLRYREGGTPIEGVEPLIVARENQDVLEVVATLALGQVGAHLRLGLCAVIKPVEGNRAYWALKHPADKPDFHHAEAWILELESS